MVKAPGVVTGRYGTIGDVFYQSADFWPLNTTLWVSNFHGNDERFIYYLMQRVNFSAHSGKSGVPGVNRNDLHTEIVELPNSPAEQSKIAAALVAADDYVTLLERAIAKRQAIAQGMMQQLLTGKTRLPGFSGEWQRVTLGDVARFRKGSGLPKSDVDAGGSAPCVHYGELFTKYGPEIDLVDGRTNNTALNVRSEALDVLMPTSDVTPRGLAKASAIRQAGAILGGDILIIRPDATTLYGPFLAHVIRQDAKQVLQLVRGSTVYHLYASDMRNFLLAAPSIEEQVAVTNMLRDAGKEVEALRARLGKARLLKQGMMQELLTGRTRLPINEVAS